MAFTPETMVRALRLAADDPMWAHHVEMPKSMLKIAADMIEASMAPAKTDEGRNAVSDESDSGRNKFIAGKLRKHVEFVKFCDVDKSPFHASNLIDDLFEAAAALEAANLCGRNAVADEIQAAFDKGYRAAGGTITPVIFQTDSREG